MSIITQAINFTDSQKGEHYTLIEQSNASTDYSVYYVIGPDRNMYRLFGADDNLIAALSSLISNNSNGRDLTKEEKQSLRDYIFSEKE